MTLTIRPETPIDHPGIFEVNRQAIGQDAEANLVNVLRMGAYAKLSLVAELNGKIVGHILFSTLPIYSETGVVAALVKRRWGLAHHFEYPRPFMTI
jgi:putative acetyltransferase